jgi:dipeptidyl-peptidase 4
LFEDIEDYPTMKLATALSVACSLALTAAPTSAAQDTFLGVSNPDLSIDMLYQHRSLIGTTPENYAWSADGSTVAFVWNDEGYSFRDVWSFDLESGTLSRLTFHGEGREPDDESRGVSEALPLGGGRLAYVLDGFLHLQDADGHARRIENDKGAIRQLTLEPGGDHIAFISGGAVDGRQDRFIPGGGLWARRADAEGDVESALLAGDENPKIYVHEYRWAPHGGAVAFTQADNTAMPERDIHYYADGGLQQYTVARAFPGDETTRYTVGVVSLEGGGARFFERPDPRHHVWGYGLSEDGARLFINSSDMLVKDHTVYVYDVVSGAREVAYHEHDPLHLRPDWQVEWAPGDDGLVILTDREGFLHLHHQREAGGEVERLTQGEWEIARFWVDRARSLLYFSANEASLPERQVYRIPLAGGEIERVSGDVPGTHEPVFAPGHAHAASFFTNDTTPPELHVLDLSGAGAHLQVTDSPQPEFHDQAWADISYVEFESHVDGVTLIGRLSLPADHDHLPDRFLKRLAPDGEEVLDNE